MPQNTRVWRCVEKLKKKYKYKGAIAICQSTTEQSYKTGKQTRKKQTRKTAKTERNKPERNKPENGKDERTKRRKKIKKINICLL